MKLIKSLFFMSIISGATDLNAQPSDQTVANRLKSAGALEVKFTSPSGTVHTLPHEKYYERTTESKWKTDAPGVYRWERVDNRYDYQGGSWVFNRSYFGGAWYDGIPNPTEEEIIKVLEDSHVGYQGAVMEKPTYKLAANPKWNWHTFNSVEFDMEVTYWKKKSYSEIEKVKALIPFRLYKDCGGGTYDQAAKTIYKNAPWLSVEMSVFPSVSEQTVLETRQLSESEQKNLKNMNEMAEAIENEKKKAAWTKYAQPQFINDEDAIYYFHSIMWEGDLNKIEWMAFTYFTKYYFEDSYRTLMNNSGKELLKKLQDVAPKYPYLYCEYPNIKHQQANMIQFYDRENQSTVRISLTPVADGTFQIQDFDCLFYPNDEKLESCKSASITNCGQKPEIKAEVKPESFQVNDLVTVNWNGQGKDFFDGKVIKTDPYDPNRYFIEFEAIQSAWIDAKYMSKTGSSPTSTSSELTVGQRVEVNWKGQGRWFPGKIAEIDTKNNKYLIKYDDGDQEWTTKTYIK